MFGGLRLNSTVSKREFITTAVHNTSMSVLLQAFINYYMSTMLRWFAVYLSKIWNQSGRLLSSYDCELHVYLRNHLGIDKGI